MLGTGAVFCSVRQQYGDSWVLSTLKNLNNNVQQIKIGSNFKGIEVSETMFSQSTPTC